MAALPDHLLDCTPLAQPVNPFAWMIELLMSRQYPNQESLDAAMVARSWLRQCATTINVKHTDPVLLAAICRLAMDGSARMLFEAVIPAIEREVVASRGGQPAAPAGSNGHGLRMPAE